MAAEQFFQPSRDVVVAVKLIVGSKPRLGLAEHCGGSIWTFTPLDKTVKARDVRAMADVPLAFVPLPRTACRAKDIIAACTIKPNWKSKPKSTSLRMMPPITRNQGTLVPPPHEDLPEDLDSQLVALGNHSPMKKSTLDVSSMLSAKYYTALYAAQTPVSYFAKSALSRARAMCKEKYQPLDDSLVQRVAYLEKLIAMLKTMILDLSDFDSKYEARNFWQAVKSTQFSAYSRDEQKAMKSWAAEFNQPESDEESISEEFKSALRLLKTRETQLQVIILLETLALEYERDSKLGKVATVTTISPNRKPLFRPQKSLVRLKRQPKIAHKEIKVKTSIREQATAMFDRLCIGNDTDEKINLLVNNAHFNNPAQAIAAADKTQEFCREAIMPFFSSRLPDLCRTFVQSCRGISTTISRRHSTTKPTIASEKKTIKPVKRTESLATLTDSFKASKTTSFRGGVNPLNYKTSEDRRQIEMTFRSSLQDEDELHSAIKNASKPSRLSVSAQYTNNLPSKTIALPKRKRNSRPPVRASTSEVKKSVEVAGTPMRRKRALGVGSSYEKALPSRVLIDGELYSGPGDEMAEDIDDVIFETPVKKKPRYTSGTNFNDRLASLSASRNPTLNIGDDAAAEEEEEDEIFSSPLKTPRRDPGLIFQDTISSGPHEVDDDNNDDYGRPLNPIYDENSPRFLYPDRSPLLLRKNQPGLMPSPSKHKFPLTESGKKNKSKKWFDDEFPVTKTQSGFF